MILKLRIGVKMRFTLDLSSIRNTLMNMFNRAPQKAVQSVATLPTSQLSDRALEHLNNLPTRDKGGYEFTPDDIHHVVGMIYKGYADIWLQGNMNRSMENQLLSKFKMITAKEKHLVKLLANMFGSHQQNGVSHVEAKTAKSIEHQNLHTQGELARRAALHAQEVN